MSEIEMIRTWTATIEVLEYETRETRVLQAPRSESDLLRDQENVALLEAAKYVDDSHRVEVVIWKTTKGRGTVKDRFWNVYEDKHGKMTATR